MAITVEALVRAPREQVWKCWTEPEHITHWCRASDDWHAPIAENDVRVGGEFMTRMEEKSGGQGFDFRGTYTEVVPLERLAYAMEDGRKVLIEFTADPEGTRVREMFDPENENPEEMQRAGWQAILNNFTTYAENQSFPLV